MMNMKEFWEKKVDTMYDNAFGLKDGSIVSFENVKVIVKNDDNIIEHGFPNRYGDFDFSVSNEVYSLDIHNTSERDDVIVVDFGLNSDYEIEDKEVEFHQMILSSKEMLKSLLLIFFGFNDKETEDILDAIKEDKKCI